MLLSLGGRTWTSPQVSFNGLQQVLGSPLSGSLSVEDVSRLWG